MRTHSIILSAVLAIGTLSAVPVAVHAAVQGTVTIEQLSPANKFGSWTLLAADSTTRSSTDAGVDPKSYSYSVSEVGQMILSVVPPSGMSSKIGVYRNGELVKTILAQQYEFSLYPNDKYRFLIQYAYTKLGTLGVTSDPSGLLFRVLGPKRLTGKTPKTFENLPAGRYTIYMGKSGNCLAPAPQSVVVTSEARVTKLLKLSCDVQAAVEPDRTEHLSRRALQEAVEAREAKERGTRK